MDLLSRLRNREYADEDMTELQEEEPRYSKRAAILLIRILSCAIAVLLFLVFFYVQDIEITGNEYCDALEIADAVQSDAYSVNSLFVCLKYNLGFGKKPECIDTIRVSLKTPWTLKVKVQEKEIVGYVLCEQTYGYFDKDGVIVMVSSELIQGMPVIEGIDVTSMEKYKELKLDDKKLFGEILSLSLEIKKCELDPDKIIVHEEKLYLMMGNVLVSLGSKISPEQIAQIEPILKKLGNQSGILHLENYSDDQKNIIFKKAEMDTINAFLNSSKSIFDEMKEEEEKEAEEEEEVFDLENALNQAATTSDSTETTEETNEETVVTDFPDGGETEETETENLDGTEATDEGTGDEEAQW